jgi:hypothetical protein
LSTDRSIEREIVAQPPNKTKRPKQTTKNKEEEEEEEETHKEEGRKEGAQAKG